MQDRDRSNVAAASDEQQASSEVPPPPPPPLPPTEKGRPPRSPEPRAKRLSLTSSSEASRPTSVPAPSHERVQSSLSDVSFDSPPGPWDSKAVADVIDQVSGSGDVADETPSSKIERRLTLADVKAASPMEAEAETLLMEAIDEREDNLQTDDTVLPNIPTESVDAFEAQPVEPLSGSVEERFQEVTDDVRKSNAGTNSKLAGLTHAMRLLHEDTAGQLNATDEQQQHLQTDPPSFTNEPMEQEIPSSDADKFLTNANLLFRRNSVSQRKEEPASNTSPDHDSTSNTNMDVEYGSASMNSTTSQGKHSPRHRVKRAVTGTKEGIKREANVIHDFLEPRKGSIYSYCKWMMLVFILPLTLLAIILFYAPVANNPMLRDTGASISWLLLFLVRNLITMSLAKALEIFVIYYLGLRKRFLSRVFGPVCALIIVQSRGYPCVLFFYGFISLFLLCGYSNFVKWWLYYQDAIHMCNASNPAGMISESRIYVSVIGCCMIFGVAVTLKRHWLGLRLGRRTYLAFGDTLAKVMNKMLLISEVATLSLRQSLEIYEDDSDLKVNGSFDTRDSLQSQPATSSSKIHGSKFYQSFNDSQKMVIMQHLEAWEEPVINKKKKQTDASISAILQFKTAVSLVDSNYPFSVAFGPADKREKCIESSQKVYERLLRRQGSGDVLHFNTIAKIAVNKDGTINKEKLKELVRLFRPSREGELTMIDFVKSTDEVYKEFRKLQASIENSGSVDRAFELLVNWAFYIILWCFMLYIMGIDPLALFVSISSFAVGFAFMIGNASSKYFEGLLFVLVRRPYEIGDRIAVSDPETDTSNDGSTTWFVEDLGLYSTTVRLAATNEVATYSNGSLANSRVINAARSPQAVIAVLAKFGVNVKYAKIQLFKKSVEKFVKERPREWIGLLGFRATRVEQDQGFIEYIVVLQHRESWQNIGAILNSKAEVTSFTLEVSKQLGMRYNAPPLPVTLNMSKEAGQTLSHAGDDGTIGTADLGNLFQQIGAGVSEGGSEVE